ncbi:DUF4097 family beta strand repeat-containing protein [Actinoplanes sp. NPDC000266]
MRRFVPLAVLVAVAAACAGPSETGEKTYKTDTPITALVVDARAATVTIETADGPVSVREEHRWSDRRPTTANTVDGQTLRLTESGCGGDDVRCDVKFHVVMPAAVSADISSQAGAVKIDGLTGNLRVRSQAAAVEATALGAGQVTVETRAGAVSLEFAEAPGLARVTSDAGAVTVRVPDTTAYAVEAAVSMGARDVSVREDPTSPHHIQVKTSAGAVRIEPRP